MNIWDNINLKALKDYNEYDLFGQIKLSNYIDLVKSEDEMSRWDCYSAHFNHRIELKCRGKHYDTLLIEKSKYDYMVDKAHENLEIPMYICSTPKGIYCFNLLRIKPNWIIEKHNKTTQFDNNKKIEKIIGNLSIHDKYCHSYL
tara:strand:+ start:6324 stop:6755 length:432 start_codon:yes stop_codon:yes gene_type:complete